MAKTDIEVVVGLSGIHMDVLLELSRKSGFTTRELAGELLSKAIETAASRKRNSLSYADEKKRKDQRDRARKLRESSEETR